MPIQVIKNQSEEIMRIQLLRNETAISPNDAVQVVNSQDIIYQLRVQNDIQVMVNVVSYFGEQIAFQVRVKNPTKNSLLCVFWVPTSQNNVRTADKILSESNHDSIINLM